MRVAILHNEPSRNEADEDVLIQLHCIRHALERLGHSAIPMVCTLDLGNVGTRLRDADVDVVFNLVESLAGTDRLAAMAPLLLESLGIPFTGADSISMCLTSDKVGAKRTLAALGVATPATFTRTDETVERGRYIVKPRFEDASVGMDDSAVVDIASAADLRALLIERERCTGYEMFAESYIDGREFNLALLDGEPLPAAEIDFTAFPPNKPRIVGYSAKWVNTSFEFAHTPRTFTFPASDRSLLERMHAICRTVWHGIPLRGYARVDLRVDNSGVPHVLEINANPCLSPDAGFAAATLEAGISYEQMVCRLLDNALTLGGSSPWTSR